MTRFMVSITLCAVFSAAGVLGQEPVKPGGEFSTDLERNSYALGMSFGMMLQRRKVDVSMEQLFAGLRDTLSGQDPRLDEEEAEILARRVQVDARKRLLEERAVVAERNREEGSAFLSKNKERPGVMTTQSGLQYEVLREGTGARPGASDTVRVHYRGVLIDGSPFDSSYDRGQPATVRPDRVIPAWTEALPMMSVGSKWRLYVPPELGFEKLGVTGPNIPPGGTLIYEVELLSVEPG